MAFIQDSDGYRIEIVVPGRLKRIWGAEMRPQFGRVASTQGQLAHSY